MIQGSSHFQKVITVLTVTYLLHVNAATNNEQVIKDIDKLQEMVKNLQTPPELIGTVLKQLDTHCPKSNRTNIDESYVNNASKCIEQHLNVTQLAEEMKAAVPEGKMDNVFRDICMKWPKVKGCINDFFKIVDDCWQKGNKIDAFVDEVVKFYCGNDNSGERIALFFADGGLECMQEHGNDVKTCIETKQNFEIAEDQFQDLSSIDLDKIPIPKKDEICENIDQLYECASIGFRKCKDPTTENLMTSMLKQVGKELECKVTETSMPRVNEPSGGHQAVVALESLVLLMAGVGLAF